MLIKQFILALLAFVSGVGVAAGTFAFILVIGVVPRILRKSNLARRVLLVENMIAAGGIIGNAVSVFEPLRLLGLTGDGELSVSNILSSGDIWQPMALWVLIATALGHILIAVYGICAGIFVGCISVALAEILNTFPILFKRLHIKRGLQWVMLMMAFGKFAGALFYFVTGYHM